MFDNFQHLALIDEDVEFLPLVSIEADDEPKEVSYADEIPVLPLRNNVLFPGVVIPITVGRERSIKAVKVANSGDRFIGVIAQKSADLDEPELADLSPVGTIARIVKMLRMPDGSTTVILHGRDRFSIREMVSIDPYLKASITVLKSEPAPTSDYFDAMMSSMKDLAMQIVDISPNIPSEAAVVLKNIDNPEFLIHFISSNLNVEVNEKQELLEISDLQVRAEKVLEKLSMELQMQELKAQIHSKVKVDIDKQQRDYFLHQQIKIIQEELGGEGFPQEIKELKARSLNKKWTKAAQEAFNKELKKLQRMNPAMAEYSLSLNYLDLLVELPWGECTKDKFDLKNAQKILDQDHFGLEKVKNRILEYLAVLKLKGDMKSPILCLVGPPGVGKTSLGYSIGRALQRKYIRMSLGGLHDESEIRGHRRTYIGSMPGRIIQSLKKVKTSNPVFILDEIDKVGNSFRGDPASALLEVLDPEQNSSFYDNYLELDYDLSKVMFLATANSLSTIHPALRDRMEIIHVTGYSVEEKLEIARRHLVPKQMKAHGLTKKHIRLNKKPLTKIVKEHTRESGVRELERKVASVMRSIAKSVAMEEEYNVSVTNQDIRRILGPQKYDSDMYRDENPPGVAVGLAWTQVGGEILFIEATKSKGKGSLTLTGNLGDVMKESATTALSYIKSNAEKMGIDPELFDTTNFHLHVPEGAIPKDGPSAGVAMLTTLTSLITDQKVKPYVAMTGEITLRGKVLPVGGIKEKVLAAKRAGIKEIILCELNRKDVEEINTSYIKDVTFHFVKEMQAVVKLALVKG